MKTDEKLILKKLFSKMIAVLITEVRGELGCGCA